LSSGEFHIPHIFLVLARLGLCLLELDALYVQAITRARYAVRSSLVDNDMLFEFELSPWAVQDAITCGIIFCSKWRPMHIWQGFGFGVLGRQVWTNLTSNHVLCGLMDRSIDKLKGRHYQGEVIKKLNFDVDSPEPFLGISPDRKKLKKYAREFVKKYERHGFPQPLPPYSHLTIQRWSIPFSPWKSCPAMYYSCGHSYDLVCTYQIDPGKLLYSWVVDGHARLMPGDAMLLLQDHVMPLARWLEGLKGMSFKVLRDSQLDYSNIELSSWTKRFNKKHVDNRLGLVMVGRQPLKLPMVSRLTEPLIPRVARVVEPQRRPQSIDLRSRHDSPPPSYSRSRPSLDSEDVVSSDHAVKVVKATHCFIPTSDKEMGFNVGDQLVVLDEVAPDGWYMAKTSMKTGLIPRALVC